MMAARTPSHSKPISWPNRETLITSTKIVANLACYFLKSSLAKTAAINFSLRCISVYQTPSSNRYYRLSLETGAFLVLPLPYGILFSIGVDAISEAVNFYNRHRKGSSAGRPKGAPSSRPLVSPLKLLDPSKVENALKILGLEASDLGHQLKMDAKYEMILNSLVERKSLAHGDFKIRFQEMIENVQAAYKTLTAVSPLTDRLDPKNTENALKILGLQPEDIKNPGKIDSQHQIIIEGLIVKRASQAMMDDVNTAYQTLTSAKNEK